MWGVKLVYMRSQYDDSLREQGWPHACRENAGDARQKGDLAEMTRAAAPVLIAHMLTKLTMTLSRQERPDVPNATAHTKQARKCVLGPAFGTRDSSSDTPTMTLFTVFAASNSIAQVWINKKHMSKIVQTDVKVRPT